MSSLPALPITAIKAEFGQLLTQHNTVVLSAPPGAGKSTGLPLWLLTLPALTNQKIYLLQPRRLAVKNIANFLASQLGERVGDTIGYRLRHEKSVSAHTRIEVITEGILTQIIQQDAELVGTALIVFDEFHERSLQGDLAFALAREVQTELRDDLKILLMSATIDSDNLLGALPDAVSITSEGRSFPVDIEYQAPTNAQYWREHAVNVIKQQAQQHDGAILVFLPGVGDIRFVAERLASSLPDNTLICPLYGELSLREQQLAIAPSELGVNKVVLATNIAETSLTIEGVNLVIDSGLEKVAIYDSASLLNKLVQKQIAKASAIQRAGRAGRLMPGKCIRLFAKDSFDRRPQYPENAIQQADLLPTLIEAARWGVSALAELPMLELPSASKEQQGWQELESLLIVDRQKRLTAHGGLVAALPCHPRFAHMIFAIKNYSKANNQVLNSDPSLACLMAALLEERDIFRAEQAQHNINLVHRLQLFTENSFTNNGLMKRIVKQAQIVAKRADISFNINNISLENTGLILALAYPERVAKVRGRANVNSGVSACSFLCANGKGAQVNSDDALANEEFLVLAQLMQFNHQLSAKLAASIDLSAIELLFSEQVIAQDNATFDTTTGKIIARHQSKLGALVLNEQKVSTGLNEQNISTMWCDLVRQKGLSFLNWQAKDIALKARWQWLNHYVSELKLPMIDEDYLLNHLPIWFAPFVGAIKSKAQLDKIDLSAMLLSLLDYQQQQQLKHAAPTVFIGPTGRHCPITYNQEKSPKVSLPMQELYGLTQTPCVGIITGNTAIAGIPLLLELLSPAQRPIQVTQDLVQFWQGSYQAVQKDMKSRYPKHYWPDDPANAVATNKTKRHIKTT
ncbi:ATP-dependent helicase HrpB [Colwellia asteriadis]|uniref:ATP-dependent helicase HrpB n=1 Tax=Colwellia asteriadis TaxID=517723 RepID=A0ABP3WF75_9GAMM